MPNVTYIRKLPMCYLFSNSNVLEMDRLSSMNKGVASAKIVYIQISASILVNLVGTLRLNP
jgi:hypothetical protein